MLPAENTICGVIEFEPYEARLALRSAVGGDETVHATLLSIAQDLLFGDEGELTAGSNESAVSANVERLEHDLLFIYRRIQIRRRLA